MRLTVDVPEAFKQQMIETCQKLYAKGYLAACDGNVSLRLDEHHFLVTPTGRSKASLKKEDLVIVDSDGKVQGSDQKPSSEMAMHLSVYKHAPRARAVVHAHPPIATAWSIAQPHLRELPSQYCSELILACGSIPIVPYARPGTVAMGQVLIPYLPDCRVMILAHHGSLSFGESLEEAFLGTERLEHVAKTLMYARSLGALHELPQEEIDYLRALRKQLGNKVL